MRWAAAVWGAALAFCLAGGASAQTRPSSGQTQADAQSSSIGSFGQTRCGSAAGGVYCSGGSAAQQYGSQRARQFGRGGSDFARSFAAAGSGAPIAPGRGSRHRITTYSDGTTATSTQYGRHSVVVYSDGRVQRCQKFGAQQVCH